MFLKLTLNFNRVSMQCTDNRRCGWCLFTCRAASLCLDEVGQGRACGGSKKFCSFFIDSFGSSSKGVQLQLLLKPINCKFCLKMF